MRTSSPGTDPLRAWRGLLPAGENPATGGGHPNPAASATGPAVRGARNDETFHWHVAEPEYHER